MEERTCAIEGCEERARSRGWCLPHYGKWWRANRVAPSCSVEGCERPHRARGLCTTHRYRLDQGLDLNAPVGQYERGERLCKIVGCSRPRTSSGTYCPMHRQRLVDRGSLGGPNPDRAPNGQAIWSETEYRRRYERLRKYGLTPEEFEQLLASQGGRCAVCRSADPQTPKRGTWCVDHDHVTGQIRGLLCNLCNRAIGML